MDVVVDRLPDLLRALRTTLHITLLGFLIGSVIGLAVAVLRVSPIRPMRRVASAYTSLMVNSPLLFIVFLAFYGTPKLGFLINEFRTAALATGLYLGGYIAEALRAGFNTVSNGQAEAARAIGLSFTQVLRHVVLPQALRSSVGPLGVLLNATYRNVAVAGAIGVNELVKVGRVAGEETARQYPFYVFMFGAFAVLGLLTGGLANWLDRKVAVRR
jgi:glutamate transport system permease protein